MRHGSFLEDLGRIRDKVNLLFEQALVKSGLEVAEAGTPGTWTPSVDVLETGESYQLVAELPGLERSDIELTVRDRRLELSGRREPHDGQAKYHRMERRYGPFHWHLELGDEIDTVEISATFHRGLLTIVAPKATAPGGRTGGVVPITEAGAQPDTGPELEGDDD